MKLYLLLSHISSDNPSHDLLINDKMFYFFLYGRYEKPRVTKTREVV